MEIPDWSPPEWSCNCFPLSAPDAETIELDWLVQTLNALADTVTEADTAPLGKVLHVAHILKTMQGSDGKWPHCFNARTGDATDNTRSTEPLALFRRLNAMLQSTEFDSAIRFAEAGGNLLHGEN